MFMSDDARHVGPAPAGHLRPPGRRKPGGGARAAEGVRISQSGVSAQIQQLERDLGAALIDRSGRTATVTAAGQAALGHARAALSAVEDVRRAVDDVTNLVRGRLVVGMVTACTVTPLFDALAAFHGAHPGVGLSLGEHNSDRLVQRLRDGHIDLALVGVAGEPPTGLESLVLVSEGLCAIVAAEYPPRHQTHHHARRTREVSDPLPA